MNQQSPKHYSEADLLETYYTQPGQSMPVMMHLADCADCAARYERLEKKVRSLSACAHEKPETFWARQRMLVMRRIDAQRSWTFARATRVAAAAAIVVALGGVMTWQQSYDTPPAPAPVEIAVEVTTPADPWQSEELDEFQSLVAWESWEPSGDQSL